MSVDPKFEAFCAVRREQSAASSWGLPAFQAYQQGSCHVLAIAIQKEIGGDIVVATPRHPDDLNHLGHAAVLKDGLVFDAGGISDSGYWSEVRKVMSQMEPTDFRMSSRAELEMMKADAIPTPSEIEAAAPLARAIGEAHRVGVDPKAWRSMLPAGSMSHILPSPEREDRAAYESAMSASDEHVFPPISFAPARVMKTDQAILAARVASMGRMR